MPEANPPFLLKICGLTCFDDAQAAVAAGANALGFNFYSKSPRYVTPEQAQAIASATTGTYLKVGVFVSPTRDELLSVATTVPLDVVQVHAADPAQLANLPLRLWQAVPGESTAGLAEGAAEAYLLDAVTPDHGGSGRTFRWELAQSFNGRAIVAGGLDASNVAAAIAALHPWGVDACSRLESRPGKKDLPKMRAFLEAARLALLEQHMVKL